MLESLTVGLALSMMAIVVFGKLYFAQSIAKIQLEIATVDHAKTKILSQLKAISGQKSIAESKGNSLDIKKARLEKRLTHVKRELKKIAADQGKIKGTNAGKIGT